MLLILPIIIGILIPFIVSQFSLFSSSEEIVLFYAVKDTLYSLLYLIAYFLLWRIAPDASAKTAAVLLGASSLISLLLVVCQRLLQILINLQPLPLVFGVIVKVVSCLVAVYALSLLLRNRRLGASDRSWIGLLAIGQCMGIIFCFRAICFDYTVLPWSHILTLSRYYPIFDYGWCILNVIAVWRLAHCSLFAGRRAETEPLPAGFYSPLNRYMVAVVIASAVAVGFLALLYANANRIVG